MQTLLEKAISLNDADPSGHFEPGHRFRERTQHYAEAARELERSAVQALDPSDPTTHYRLSRVYDRLGRTGRSGAAENANCTGEMVEAEEAGKRNPAK